MELTTSLFDQAREKDVPVVIPSRRRRGPSLSSTWPKGHRVGGETPAQTGPVDGGGGERSCWTAPESWGVASGAAWARSGARIGGLG